MLRSAYGFFPINVSMDQQHRPNMGITFSGNKIMTEIQVHRSGNANKAMAK